MTSPRNYIWRQNLDQEDYKFIFLSYLLLFCLYLQDNMLLYLHAGRLSVNPIIITIKYKAIINIKST